MPDVLPWAYQGPGTEELKLRNRIYFRLLGRWPQSVVCERLSNAEFVVDHISRFRRIDQDFPDLAEYEDVQTWAQQESGGDGPGPRSAPTVHVKPSQDLIAHGGEDCICGPETELRQTTAGDIWLVIHQSLDRRENIE